MSSVQTALTVFVGLSGLALGGMLLTFMRSASHLQRTFERGYVQGVKDGFKRGYDAGRMSRPH